MPELMPDDERWLKPRRGLPTVAAPKDIDADGADWLRTGLPEAAAYGHGSSSWT